MSSVPFAPSSIKMTSVNGVVINLLNAHCLVTVAHISVVHTTENQR